MKSIRLGTIHADYITLQDTLNYIENLAKSKAGGFVVTPNIDHVVLSQKNLALRDAYAAASLSLVDGMPLKWMSTIVGAPLPEKISGSDLMRPLLRHAAKTGLSAYFLGAAPGVAQTAANVLTKEIPKLNIVGVDSPPLGFEKDSRLEQEAIDKMVTAAPSLVFMALGCPKQEILMHKWASKTSSIVYLGIGASLDFIAGKVTRCPPWMSSMGMEWLYRIKQEPVRMAKRYLIQDSAILPIFVKMMRSSKEELIFEKD
ncbi:MAG: WecB/TagA/CpsF family glycosyltransferase [Deltaproteobacteria bacterium]|nr:WecB/TagA/CpsF family glycosyltransferase [Deltaproteobacteria bacterium]